MKKVFISAALFAAVCAFSSCANHEEFREELDAVETNASFFDKSEVDEPFQREPNRDEFLKSMERLISTYKEFPNFREVLPAKMLAKIDSGEYTEDEGVFVLYLWWKDERCGDVLIEWSLFDDFVCNMPDEYLSKYPFYI